MKYKTVSLVLGAALTPLSAWSLELNMSGFMSIVGGMTLESDKTYDVGFLGYNGVYDDEFSINPESMFALQTQVVGDDKISATVQLIGRGGDSFDIEAEWAYISYNFTDQLTLNVGRSRTPLFYYSDFLDVGYAYHWIRPPSIFYGGQSYYDGLGLNYTNYFGNVEVSGQLFYGNWQEDYETPIGFVRQEFNNTTGGSLLIGTDLIKIRASYITVDGVLTPLELPPGVPATTILNGGTFLGLALIADYKNFFLRSEMSNIEIDNDDPVVRFEDPESTQMYVSAGFNFNSITPHITFSNLDEISNTLLAQDVMTYGIAWNFNPSAVFKVEYQNAEFEDFPERDTDLLTFGIDIVF